MKYDFASLTSRFAIPGGFVSGEPYGTGHINDTFVVGMDQAGKAARYILQRINHNVFKEPATLMQNVARVTQHQHSKLTGPDACRRALTLVPTVDGTDYHFDEDGNYWRVYIFIENAATYDEMETPAQSYEAAKAFGEFMKQLRDLPGGPLAETIPDFHNTRARFDVLQQAIDADVCNRASEVAGEIAFAHEREAMVDVLLDLQQAGQIPTITTHNDTKLNNVMLDDVTGEGICVIDLDTVMPGVSLYDFGDMVRTAARPVPEDEMDLSKVVARVDMVEAIARGYLASAGDVLNAVEKEHLMFSGRLITLEIGLRFLTDYLQGDIYFKIHREAQNRDRCRVQFKMVASMEGQQEAMDRIMQDID